MAERAKKKTRSRRSRRTLSGADSGALIQLIANLMHNPELRQEFNLRRERVLDKFDLDDDERTAIYTMTPTTIAKAVSAEIDGFHDAVEKADKLFKKYEFPPVDENFVPDIKGEYPSPEPQVFRLHPSWIRVGDLPNNGADGFELVVFGQSFSIDAEISIVKDDKTIELDNDGVLVTGTLRCSRASTLVTSEDPFKAGTYNVTLTLQPAEKKPYKIVLDTLELILA